MELGKTAWKNRFTYGNDASYLVNELHYLTIFLAALLSFHRLGFEYLDLCYP